LMVSTVRGEFEKFSGTVEFDEYDLTRSKAEIQIEAASVTTHNAQRGMSTFARQISSM